MAMTSNLWKCTYNDINIEVEVYTSTLLSGGCALFVNNSRVDSIPLFTLFFTRFSLRHIATYDGKNVTIVAEVKQSLLGSKVKILINDQLIQHETVR